MALVGCGPSDGSGREGDSDPSVGSGTLSGTTSSVPNTVVVGTGANQFTALQPGGSILVVDGGQSGAHIDGAGMVGGYASDIVAIEVWSTWVADGTPFTATESESFILLAGYDAATGSGWFAGERSFTDVEGAELCEAAGTAIELCVRVRELSDDAEPAVEACVEGVIAVEPSVAAQC